MRDMKNVVFKKKQDPGSGFKILIIRIRPKMDRIRNPDQDSQSLSFGDIFGR